MSTSSRTTPGATRRSRSRSSPRSGEPGVRRSAPRPNRRAAARGRGVVASVRSAPRPRGSRAPGPGAASSVGQGAAPGRRRGCAACPRRHRRWPEGTPARHRAGTSWRRAPGTPAPPRSSAASAPTPRREPPRGGRAAPCCCDPAPSPRRPGPRQTGGRQVCAAPSWTSARSGPSRRRSLRHRGRRRGPSSGRPALRSGPATRPAAGRRPRPARRSGMARAGPASLDAEGGAAGFDDRLPAGAAAEMRQQGRLDRLARRPVGSRCSSAARRSRMPGVQKPHWLAPAATKAPAQRLSSSGSSPSTVVTERPATRRTGVTQATRAAPSTQTVQQPHWPWGLQPSLTERQPSCSRSASRREVPSIVLDRDGGPVEARR